MILEDFPETRPGCVDTEGWQPPAIPRWIPPSDAGRLGRRTDRGTGRLAACPGAALARRGRTSIGLSFQPPEAWPAFLADALAGALVGVPPLATPALAQRFLCDDIKAFYGEAAQAAGPAPSPRQVDHWFWRQTIAGALLIALRSVAMASDNNALRTVGGRFFVPVPWLPG